MIDVDTLEQIIADFEGNVHSTEFAKELIKHIERSLPKPEFGADELERVMQAMNKARLGMFANDLTLDDLRKRQEGHPHTHDMSHAQQLLERTVLECYEVEAKAAIAAMRDTKPVFSFQPMATAPKWYHPPISTINHHAPSLLLALARAGWVVGYWDGSCWRVDYNNAPLDEKLLKGWMHIPECWPFPSSLKQEDSAHG